MSSVFEEKTKRFVITVEAWPEEGQELTDDHADALLDSLLELGAEGPAVSIGGETGGPGATFSLEVFEQPEPAMWVAQAAHAGVERFLTACIKGSVPHGDVAFVEIMDEKRQELELSRPAEVYLGVSEVATMLSVSRQRISELRTKSDFPAPVAELASGPVWKRELLQRFVDSWTRTPGRPKKASLGS